MEANPNDAEENDVRRAESILGWAGMIVGHDGIGIPIPEHEALALAIPEWVDIPEHLDDAVRICIDALVRPEVRVRLAAVTAVGEVVRRYRRLPHEVAARTAVSATLRDSNADVRVAAQNAYSQIREILG